MTLCLAWKRGHSISFASDSRLSSADGSVTTDIATKIFKLYVKSYSVEKKELLHDLQYGLCFCGSYLNGSLLADTISEILSALEMKETDTIDAETIMQIAFEIFKDVSTHLMAIHGKYGLANVIIGGQCPKSKEFKIFHFTWQFNEDGNGITFVLKEEIFEDPIIFIGDSSAVKAATELKNSIRYDKAPIYTEYHLLRDIIDNKDIKGVGGEIQTGHFVNGNFKTFGMVDYELFPLPGNDKLHWVRGVYTFRGIPISRALDNIKGVTIRTGKIFMAPFTDKEKELEAEARRMNEKKNTGI